MNNYYYELIEGQFDNHKDPEITEKVIGKYCNFETARSKGLELAKELEESGRFKHWNPLHEKTKELSIVFMVERYDQKTKHLEQHLIAIEKKNF